MLLNSFTRWMRIVWRRICMPGLVLLLLVLASCASIEQAKPEAPDVSLVSVKPLNFSLSGQRLNFKLRVKNPNSFDLPVQTLDFVASFAGETIAKGLSEKAVTIPARQDAIVDVIVVAGLDKILGQFKNITSNLEDEQGVDLGYDVKGAVKLANWPLKIPFNVTGDLSEQAEEVLGTTPKP